MGRAHWPEARPPVVEVSDADSDLLPDGGNASATRELDPLRLEASPPQACPTVTVNIAEGLVPGNPNEAAGLSRSERHSTWMLSSSRSSWIYPFCCNNCRRPSALEATQAPQNLREHESQSTFHFDKL